MNKTERLHDQLQYLNDKSTFNLKDLMNRYAISRSTALRDVESLEQIGMPIYSQPGRNGCYHVLPNRLLSPITFTVEEVQALYFAMLTLKSYQSTPFHLQIEPLKEKFESCLSAHNIDKLRNLERVFRLEAHQHANPSPLLPEILQYTVEEKVCRLTYQRTDSPVAYTVQFFDLSAAYGQWYATGFDFHSDHPRVFRCDKITNLTPNTEFDPKPLSAYQLPAEQLYKKENAVDFCAELSPKGVDQFYKEHYPSMSLQETDGRYFLKGFYNQGEEDFIANYLLGYGQNLLSLQPDATKALLREKLAERIQFLR